MALDYADRCERYARQRGWTYDVHRISIYHLTPRQRRRAIKKERRQFPLPADRWEECEPEVSAANERR